MKNITRRKFCVGALAGGVAASAGKVFGATLPASVNEVAQPQELAKRQPGPTTGKRPTIIS
ncbi:MAG TPA: hypothetical protein VMV59_08065, partial [Candidatus Dormibacteraeota bacterium]|nr:hypothetical protein [Candidatus Dormibacteraeota bacterium]